MRYKLNINNIIIYLSYDIMTMSLYFIERYKPASSIWTFYTIISSCHSRMLAKTFIAETYLRLIYFRKFCMKLSDEKGMM